MGFPANSPRKGVFETPRPVKTLTDDGYSALPPLAVIGYTLDMTETEHALLKTLVELEQAVASMPTAQPKPNLLLLFARIDELGGHLPPGTDPSLRHYLHKKSYQKARLWLQGRDAENVTGSCGHV